MLRLELKALFVACDLTEPLDSHINTDTFSITLPADIVQKLTHEGIVFETHPELSAHLEERLATLLEKMKAIKVIGGEPIETVEARLRPKKLSDAGFLGAQEGLREVLKHDMETLIRAGVGFGDVSSFLQLIAAQGESLEPVELSQVDGDKHYVLFTQSWRGGQVSPLALSRKEGASSRDYTITETTTGRKLKFPGLAIDLIRDYGFFEGFGTKYRLHLPQLFQMFPALCLVSSREQYIQRVTKVLEDCEKFCTQMQPQIPKAKAEPSTTSAATSLHEIGLEASARATGLAHNLSQKRSALFVFVFNTTKKIGAGAMDIIFPHPDGRARVPGCVYLDYRDGDMKHLFQGRDGRQPHFDYAGQSTWALVKAAIKAGELQRVLFVVDGKVASFPTAKLNFPINPAFSGEDRQILEQLRGDLATALQCGEATVYTKEAAVAASDVTPPVFFASDMQKSSVTEIEQWQFKVANIGDGEFVVNHATSALAIVIFDEASKQCCIANFPIHMPEEKLQAFRQAVCGFSGVAFVFGGDVREPGTLHSRHYNAVVRALPTSVRINDDYLNQEKLSDYSIRVKRDGNIDVKQKYPDSSYLVVPPIDRSSSLRPS